MGKIWNVQQIDKKEVERYAKKNKVPKLLATLLVAKKIDEKQLDSFLNPTVDKLYSPFLLNDMEKFVERVICAKENKEKVIIYGDYDADGITSIYILQDFLNKIGVDVSYYLPDRIEEGYGLNNLAIDKFKKMGISLVITVDCGITAVKEAKHCRENEMDLLITDHHECGEVLPDAIAVINPRRMDSTYPFSYLAGVGVAFKCITALAEKLELDSISYLGYLDVVAMGTIADIVPLLDENRVITYNGIKLLNKTKNKGLQALIKVAGINTIDSDSISFGLAPRINASGRMADARVAVKLLLSTNDIEAFEYAKLLDSQNKQRQVIEKQIYDEAVEMITNSKMTHKNSIVLSSNHWHQGIIGIVASKLVEKYMKPVFLISVNESEPTHAKGSGRTPQGLSLYAALSKCSDYLISFGGHELAAGLNIQTEEIEKFASAFDKAVQEEYSGEFVQVIDIDCEMNPKNVNYELVKYIAKLAPFGQKNRMPVFILKGLKITSISTLKDGKHLKLALQDMEQTIEGLYFNGGARRDEISIGEKIDIVCTINVNAFKGEIKMQYIICDFKKGG